MKNSDFLSALNVDLGDLQAQLEADTNSAEQYCNIFILGLPRSGTSLLCQTVFSSMAVACTNNLMARFWATPLVGAYLANIVLGDRRETDFVSRFGNTDLPWEPHEFSWFWHRLLHIDVDESGMGLPDGGAVEWARVKSLLCQLSAISGKAYVHKPLELVAQFMPEFVALFDRAIFVYIDRDPMDVACSLAKVRQDRNDDMTEWWGSYPSHEEYQRLKAAPYEVQIAGQVTYLRQMYAKQLRLVPADRLIRTDYDTLCREPATIVTAISERSIALSSGIDVVQMPEPFEAKPRLHEAALRDALLAGFQIIEGWTSGQ